MSSSPEGDRGVRTRLGGHDAATGGTLDRQRVDWPAVGRGGRRVETWVLHLRHHPMR